MVKEFEKFVKDNHLYKGGESFLLAVSGGVDSMVLLHLFILTGEHIHVAHCNYGLRGEESDKDEQLVKEFCESGNVPFSSIRFNMVEELKKSGKGIQETARNLRYQWFEKLMTDLEIALLATAHHKEDSVETMIFNLSRGTGYKGMKGIDPKSKNLIRPLLFAEKNQIRSYAKDNNIPFREDESNESDKYSRNKIRKKVIPQLKELNNSLVQTMYKESKIFREGASLIDKTVGIELNKNLIKESDKESLKLSLIENSGYPHLILWKWLEDKNFSSAQMDEVLSLKDSQVGKFVESETHEVIRERESLTLKTKVDSQAEDKLIADIDALREVEMFKAALSNQSEVRIEKESRHAYFDFDKIEFPLIIRRWKSGDRFVPFGRTKEDKVKDFLTHQKIPSSQKKEALVLCSAKEILWVIGIRTDDRFKIGADTEKVLHLELI